MSSFSSDRRRASEFTAKINKKFNMASTEKAATCKDKAFKLQTLMKMHIK